MNATETNIYNELKPLLTDQARPCLSLYLTTHRAFPENQQDPIRYKNLLKELEESLLRRYSPSEADNLLEPFRALADDTQAWNHNSEGLAVLGAPGIFRTIKLDRPVADLAIAANSFHIKPLLRTQRSSERYQVLSLNRGEIRLFEGDGVNLEEVVLATGVPRTLTEALGSEHTEPHQTVSSYGGTALGSNMRHSHGSKKDEIDIDTERFFRVVDRAILQHHSRPSGLPLILATLTQHQTPFRRISHNPFLLENGIEMDAHLLTLDQLKERAWAVVKPEFDSRVRKLVEQFEQARAKGLGTDDLKQVAHAAAESRVESLLVEAERTIPGRLNPETGSISLKPAEDPQIDDLLDDLAELVLNRGGQVRVLSSEDMPTSTGVAATFRY
jgi:hypothetical protein